MDDGLGGDFQIIAGSVPQLYRIHEISSLTAGRNYSFQYRLHNVKGWSQFSPVATYQPATSPDAPPPPLFVNATADSIYLQVQAS